LRIELLRVPVVLADLPVCLSRCNGSPANWIGRAIVHRLQQQVHALVQHAAAASYKQQL
jgi:hypothetical protein